MSRPRTIDRTLVLELLRRGEGSGLDFKLDQYAIGVGSGEEKTAAKAEFVKDLLSFVNAWHDGERYIVVGVRKLPTGEAEVCGITNVYDDANFQQIANGRTNQRVLFDFSTIDMDGRTVGVFRIPAQTRPIYLEKPYKDIAAHTVYVRRGSSTAIAKPDEIRDMGREPDRVPDVQLRLEIEFEDEKANLVSSAEAIRLNTIRLPRFRDSEILNYKTPQEIQDEFDTVGALGRPHALANYVNRDFYREQMRYELVHARMRPIRLVVANTGSSTLHDVRVTLTIRGAEEEGDELAMLLSENMPEPPREMNNPMFYSPPALQTMGRENEFSEAEYLGGTWRVIARLRKIQPKQNEMTANKLFIGADHDCTMQVSASVSADSLAEPYRQEFTIAIHVVEHEWPPRFKRLFKKP